jgi:hypothetical protein
MRLVIILILLFAVFAFSDTPPPNTVKVKLYSGDGLTPVAVSGDGSMMCKISNTEPIPVSATVTVDPAGLATEAKQDVGNNYLDLINTILHGTVNVNTSLNPLTNSELRANAVSSAITNFPSTQNVSGTITINNPLLAVSSTGILQASATIQSSVLNSIDATLALIKAKTDNLDVALSTRTKPADIQNVSGSISIDTSSIATAANQTNGNQKVQIAAASGTIAGVRTISSQIVSTDSGLITNAVLHGLTTGGGGGYVDVKVNPSGALVTDSTGSVVSATVTNFPSVYPVTGTFWQATQPVSIASTVITSSTGTVPTLITNSILTTSGTVSFNGIQPVSATISNLVATSSTISNLVTTSGTISFNGIQPVSATISNLVSTSSTISNTVAISNSALTSIDNKTPSLGQALMANSSPVVIASNQSTIPVSSTGTAITSGTVIFNGTQPVSATIGNLVSTSSTISNLVSTSSTISNLVATSGTVSFNGAQTVNLGTIGTAATAANQTTGNSSLSSIDTKTPALGQTTMTGSTPVVIASNQTVIPVSSTGTVPVTFSGTVTTSGTVIFNGIQPVSATIGNLVTTSGTVSFNGVQPVSSTGIVPTSSTVQGSVTINNSSIAVTGPLTDAQLRASPVPISGSISAVNNSVASTGAAVPASATFVGGSDGTNLRALKVSATGVLSTDGSATTQPVSIASTVVVSSTGTVPVSIQNSSLVVSSTGIVPVSATITNTVPISGSTGRTWTLSSGTDTVSATVSFNGVQAVSSTGIVPTSSTVQGSVTILNSSLAVTGPLTDTQLRASAVPVSSTGIVPVSATISNLVSVTPSGTFAVSSTGVVPTSSTVQGSVGRTWNLAFGSDSVSATIGNQITTSGTISFNGVQPVSSTGVVPTSSTVQGSVGRTWNLSSASDTVSGTFTLNGVGVTSSTVSFNGIQPVSATISNLVSTSSTISNTVNILEIRPSTATTANVSGSATNVTCLASNANRRNAVIYNDSSSPLRIKYGATSSLTSFTYYVASSGTWTMDIPAYTGIIDCIWESATGSARVTEY